MAFGDQKRRKQRKSSYRWTQADESNMRRQDRERKAAEKRQQDWLDSMSPSDRREYEATQEAERVERQEKFDENQAEYALQLKLKREALVADSTLMAGFIQSEIASAVAYRERYGLNEGDWLDDPVAALTGQGGFGEEVSKSVGIKIQINLCLDTSNSMWHNGLADVSTSVMRTMYLALDKAAEQLPDNSLNTEMWLWAKDANGKGVEHIEESSWSSVYGDDNDPRGLTKYLPDSQTRWTGEDTWLHPLLDELDQWEMRNGDPGAYRIDIIISDGMLEHPTDARQGDIIQERRNGNLQSIVLNFLPMSEWGNYRVPNKCVQYPATAENLMGLMRGILGEWLVTV